WNDAYGLTPEDVELLRSTAPHAKILSGATRTATRAAIRPAATCGDPARR
ncbi:MAG: hypothetical protein AVDCRST_MAG55-1644, partial [uncultured Rubrobacteraceae bacterium]